MKSGGSASPASHETVDRREHYVYQEGAAVFKQAVKGMSSSCRTIWSATDSAMMTSLG